MGLMTGLAGLAAVAGIGGVATQAPALAGATTTAATTSSTSTSTSTIATTTTALATPAPATARRCDDGDWRGPAGINVDGRPDNLDAGDRGAVYLWHGVDGWHLRTTDVTNTAHHYTGTVALSSGARFIAFAPVRLEHDDRVWVDGDNVLHYDFTTYRGIDGLNFTVSACDGARQHETMLFTMDINGHEDDPARIDLGDRKQHPPFATFTVSRAV
jgi:hypothetical protein